MFGFTKKVLDWNLAKELVNTNKDKIIWDYDSVTLEWAEILSAFKWHEIQLHLKSLNSTVAKELAKFDWKEVISSPCSLFLEVSNRTEDTIEALSEFKWDLIIWHIKFLDRKLSKAFAKFHWYRLWFWGLDNLKEEIADKLAESKAKKLRLIMNDKKISTETAESLSRFKWEELRLEWIENIIDLDESIACELANFGWKHLILYWIKKIENRRVAKELAKFKWEFLHLEDSTLLSMEALKELNECKWFQNWLDKYIWIDKY